MTSVVSLEGLQWLLAEKQQGRPLPENWQGPALEYIYRKAAWIQRKEDELQDLKAQLREATGIAKILGIL